MSIANGDRPQTAITISSTSSSPQRRASVISISSTEDTTSGQNKRTFLTQQEIGAYTLKFGQARSLSSGYGDVNSDADFRAATRQIELFRSWVDAGIKMAIRETKESIPYESPQSPDSQSPFHPSTSRMPATGSAHAQPYTQPTTSHSAIASTRPIATVERLSVAIRHQKTRPLPSGTVPHPSIYLSWKLFVQRFGVIKRPERLNCLEPLQFRQAWISWLQQLGLDEMPYEAYWTGVGRSARSARIKVELAWAKEPLEKRRVVEEMAIWMKYKSFVDIHAIPLRALAAMTPKIFTLPFHEIERQYFFNIGTFSNDLDLSNKRRDWLSSLGFHDAVNIPLPRSSIETEQLNQVYMRLSVPQRKRIETKAKFLKLVARPCSPSWRDLEVEYEIFPRSCFISFTEYRRRRGQWLQALGLNLYPFSYINTVEKYNEVAEVAWNEMEPGQRETIKDHAKFLIDGSFPYVESWSVVEDIFGFSLDVDFDGNETEYNKHRNSWLMEINVNAPSTSKDSLEQRWQQIPLPSKKATLARARSARERFCRETQVLHNFR